MTNPLPGDDEIRAAYAHGEEAVLALFHRVLDAIRPRIQEIESLGVPTVERTVASQREIHQGDMYWVAGETHNGIDAGIMHPHVVIQEDAINHSRIRSVVVCALTSNTGRVSIPGNVLLQAGEANLPRQSVVEVSKVSAVDKAQLGAYIGSLTAERVEQILAGMRFLQSITRNGASDDKKLGENQ